MKLKRSIKNGVVILFIATLGLFPLIVGNVSAVPPKGSDVVTITFWYTENDAEKPGVLQLVTDFETANPNIDVEASQISFFDARNLFTNSFIAGTESMVLRATRDWIPEFAAAGMLLPLTDTFEPSDLTDFIDAAIEMVTYPDSNGTDQLWAYPQLVDTPAIMYNIDIFELAGINTSTLTIETSWTWDEYWDILLQVNGTEYTYGEETIEVYATTLAGMMFGGQPYYFGNGARMFSNDTVLMDTAAINSTESRAALEFMHDVTNSTVTPNWLDQGWGPLNPMFRAGEVAMINQGPWELKQNIETEAIFEEGDNLGILQLPHDADGNRGAPVGMHGMVASSHLDPASAEYEAAVDFIQFITSVEAQELGAIEYYHVPSRQSVMESEYVINNASFPYVKAYWDAVQESIRVPISKDWAQIEADFGDRINDYLADQLTLDGCIAQTLVLWSEYVPSLVNTDPGIISGGGISGYSSSLMFLIAGSSAVAIIGRIVKKRK